MANPLEINFIKKFTGYKNYRDITNLAPTDITAGSQNVLVEDGVKISVRGGSRYLGIPGTVGVNSDPSWTIAHRIHSDYDKFVNNQGTIMPFRVFYSGTAAQGDVTETWLPTFVAGVPQATKKWYQINATAPSNPINSVHEWYWAEWYDSLHGNNRIVMTYGSTTVQSYTGGYAPITATTGTTIVTNGTWLSKGFINAPEGINTIVVNVSGVPTEIPLTSGDFSTNTVTVASTAGIVVDDVAFQAFNHDSIDNQATPTGFVGDVCSTINNQVYYEDWKQRNALVSWNRNRLATSSNIVYSGSSGLNDAVFAGTYTGTQTDTIQVIIDGVYPSVNNQTFSGTGSRTSNWVTSGYNQSGQNQYRLVIVSDLLVTFTGGVTPAFTTGEIINGNTSGALLRVTDLTGSGAIYVHLLSGNPQNGETFTGQSSGTTSPAVVALLYQNEGFLYKNGVQVTGLTGMLPSGGLQFTVTGNQFATAYDGLNFNITQIGGDNVGDYYDLTIRNASPDTFAWSLNGTTQASGIATSTSPIALTLGITVHWIQTTGHNIGDNWTITEYPMIDRGWRQVYYTQPTRLPGEGFLIRLDSNGWTMNPQQNSMYMNGQAGEYYDVTAKLSADLLSETISVQRLKTERQKKALFPYLMTSEPNYLSIVSEEKTWDILGQQKFLQLPQSKTFSDFVRVDFQVSDWTNGRQTYMDRKQFFVVPEEGSIFVYDDFMKYWHPPQRFARRISSVANIDGRICGHSYERNETYEIFTDDMNDLDIYPIKTDVVWSYYDYGKRFNKKSMSAFALDGYVLGAPDIDWKINYGVGGCDGIQEGKIRPILCLPKDTASLGKSGLGFHGLGNSPADVIPHFTYGETFNNNNYYLRNIELSCVSPDQRWSVTAIGNDLKYNQVSNADIFNPPQ